MPRQRIRTRIERERDFAENLGDAYKPTRDPKLAAQRAQQRRERRLAAPSTRLVQCAIRGCRNVVPDERRLPVCSAHAVEIWEVVERRDEVPYLREVVGSEIARRDQIRAEQRHRDQVEDTEAKRTPTAYGDIYYVQVGDLIKVGWTSGLYERVRSYGPEAVLLAHYEATRADEAHLHRQLTPSRARGREWYRDDPIVRAFVARALREHGAPTFTQLPWTKPSIATPRVRSWRG